MKPKYTKDQILFCLSLFSNYASQTTGTQAELQDLLTRDLHTLLNNEAVIAFLGKWQMVWGPVVFVPGGIQKQQANATFIAQYLGEQPGPDGEPIPDYVIATAGTNPYSFFGWFVEDFQVVEQCPWPYGDPGDLRPMYSEGTAKGRAILTEVMNFEGKLLFEFLESMASSRSEAFTISVVGHSLGGALSSTLALEMVDRQAEWDPRSLATVETAPSAGPTAGDKDFAEYYNSRLGDRTNRIWNAIDIVPHAWHSQSLEQVPLLYRKQIPVSKALEAVIQLIVKRTKPGQYTQIVGKGDELPGEYSPDGDNPDLPDTVRFALQAGYQHTTAYHILMGVSELIQLSWKILDRKALTTVDAEDLPSLLETLLAKG